MTGVTVHAWWRRLGAARLARHGCRSVVAGVLVLGLAALTVGLTVRSGALAALGIALAVPQTIEAGRNLRDARRSEAAGLDRRRALARRMLAVRRAEEMMPSIPGGATIDLDYLPENELVTFRSQDDRVAAFDDLVTAVKETGGPLVLVGAPGAGKTFTARWVVTTLLDQAAVDDGPLAERFLLSRWDGSPLTDWLPREWARRREYHLRAAEAAELVADPAVVLVLDGLDEVPNAQRQACVDAINAFVDVHPHVRLVVCCRNREYRALAQRIESRRVRWIAPLDVDTIAAFIAAHGPAAWDRVRVALADDQALRSLLSTPLLLVAALRAFRDDPTPLLVGSMPERQHALWDGYVERMLAASHDPDRRRRLQDIALTMAATGTFELARAPRSFRPFMDYCVSRHLLRRSADGYQCLHRQLLGHLVGRAAVADDPHALRRRLLIKVRCEAKAWSNLAREALAASHHDAAIGMSRRALALDPANPTFMSDLAFHLMLGWHLDEAISVATAAEAADPNDWRPASTLAYALFTVGDIDGASAARRRAWANGDRPSDSSFLAYVLTLQGLHGEANSMLDRLRAMDDDPTRMDRAVALAALGRAGEAAEALFPASAHAFDGSLLIFTVPRLAASSLLPGDMFEVAESDPDFTSFLIFAIEHGRQPPNNYNEVTFALPVRPTGSPHEPAGYFVSHRFANQPVNYEIAQRSFAFPYSVAGIAVNHTAEDVTFTLEADGQQALVLRVPRPPRPDRHRRVETMAYIVVDGIPCTTNNVVDLPAGAVTDLTTVDIEVGTGPVADMLRQLGLPRTPNYCAWGEGLSVMHHLPRPLDSGR
jgi:Flp pilus assembly protein TadD